MNIINPNTFHCYFNSANTEGIFAKIAAPADLMITFLTQESRYNNGKGMSWETFIIYHNAAMYEDFDDDSVIIIKQTNNLKDLNLGIKKNNTTSEYFLWTTKFSGVAYISYIGQGEYSDCVQYLLPAEIPSGSYTSVISTSVNNYRAGSDAQYKNIEEGTIVYDTDKHNIKFPRWGIANYEADGGWWFYPEEEHYRKIIEADTIILLGQITTNGSKHIIQLASGNYWSIPNSATLYVSFRSYYNESTLQNEVIAVCDNPTTTDLNVQVLIISESVYLKFNSNTYIITERAYQIADVETTSAQEITIHKTVGDSVGRLNIPSSILNHYPGFRYYDTTLHKPLWWNGTNWTDANNNGPVATFGSTGNRPATNYVNVGFQYFDTTLNKPIWWAGMNWVDSNGMEV